MHVDKLALAVLQVLQPRNRFIHSLLEPGVAHVWGVLGKADASMNDDRVHSDPTPCMTTYLSSVWYTQ